MQNERRVYLLKIAHKEGEMDIKERVTKSFLDWEGKLQVSTVQLGES